MTNQVILSAIVMEQRGFTEAMTPPTTELTVKPIQ
jgi:hypothetical protein